MPHVELKPHSFFVNDFFFEGVAYGHVDFGGRGMPWGYLSSFGIEDPYRNKGWGSKALLLVKNLAFIRQKSVYLDCSPFGYPCLSFQTTWDFYFKNGFRPSGRHQREMIYTPALPPALITGDKHGH